MPRLPTPAYRLDVWTDVAAAGGTRVAFLVDAGGRAVSSVQRTRFLEMGRSSLTFNVAPDFHALAAMVPEAAVIRLTRFVPTGPDTHTEAIEEWRVVQRRRSVRRSVGPYQIRCVPIEELLLDAHLHRQVLSGGTALWRYGATDRTPADVLADVAADLTLAGYGWIVVGTVTPTALVTIALEENATPRAIISALIDALTAQGVDAEFQCTLAPDLSEYRLELVTRVAGSMAALPASTDGNAPELDFDEDAIEQVTVVIPKTPDRIDLREWQFEVASVDGATGWITIQAIGGAAAQLVAVDDQFNGKYLHRELTGRNFLITGTSLSPLRIRIAVGDLASGLAAGERLSLRATEDLAGTRRAFGTPDRWSPAEVQSTLTGPPRINVDDLYGAGTFVTAANQYRDWVARRSSLVAALPSGDFDHLTGILDLGSAPGTAPQVDDWVWFDNGVEFVPGTVTNYNAGTNQITLVPRYAGTLFTMSRAGITTARCYRPVSTPMWITASGTTGDGQLTVDAFTGGTPAAGDVLEITQHCQGTRLVELEDPGAVALTRRKLGTVEAECTGATNRLTNADMAAWAGASGDPPDDWSIGSIVGTVTRSRSTDPLTTRYGGKSWKLEFGAGASAEVFTPLAPVQPVPGMAQVAAAVALQFTHFTGSVPIIVTLYRVDAAGVGIAIGDPLRVYPLDTTVSAAEDFKAALNAWYDAVLTNNDISTWVDEQLQLGIERPAGAANPPCTVYVDIAMLVQREGLPQHPEGGVRYVVGSDATPLAVLANLTLQDRAAALVSFAGRMLDVFRLDAAHYAPWELVLGRDVALSIPPLALTRTVRLLGLSEDLDAPASVQVTLDRVRPDVGRMMAARLKPKPPAPAPVDRTTQPPAPPSLTVRETSDFDNWYISYQGSPQVTLRIDGGPETPAPASPILVPRAIYGGASKLYELFARSQVPGVEPAKAKVIVEPQPYVDPATPILTGVTVTPTFAPGDGGGEFDLNISVANEPPGTTYSYSAVVIPDSGNSLSGGGASASGIALGSFPLSTITGCAMADGDQLQVTVTPSDPTMAPKTVTVPV